MNIVQQVVILSGELSTVKDNARRTALLNDMIAELRLPFKKASGTYKGQSENSFVVIVNEQADIDTLANFAFKSFGQESILHQDANQEARLIFADGTTQRLGRLEQVSKELALTLDSYTEMDGKFYAISSGA
jgi:hypothetical protein